MTSIRTNCPRCGEVEMEAEVVVLALDESTGEGAYSFACPGCSDRIRKPADKNIVALLLSAGVRVVESEDRGPSDPQRPPGPAFTLDDVIDFHFELERPEWFEKLLDPAASH